MEKPIIAEEEEEQLQMCDTHDVESQSARCEKPHLSSSCDAILAAACTSSDDAACTTTSDLEDAPPFCIRGYVAAVRKINISKCWPFSRQLLEESIKEGKQPLLPPLSPYGCVVQVTSEYYHDGNGDSTHEDVDEACGANDGPQLQVQIDLSKFEAELDAHACAGTNVPANPLNPSVEAAPLQELQAPSTSKEEASKHGSPFGDCSLVFKRQAPRSIREIRKSIMQGCQCFGRMGLAQACRKDSCSSKSWTPSTPAMDSKLSSLNTFDGHFHLELECIDKTGIADHENVSGITQLEPCRKKSAEIKGVAYSHAGASPYGMCKNHAEMGKDVNHINNESVMLAASVPTTLQADVCENAALAKDMPADRRTEYANRRCSVSDSQSVDKSHESHNLKSSNSRQCWDTATQQDSLACLDNIPQQRCPVCLIFQSSSNTALNVHIDRCLAALSMEEGTTKLKVQKGKVRKKRSMAELCLVAPSSVMDGEHINENTPSDCNIKSQKNLKKEAPENKGTTTQKRNEDCNQKSKVNTFKLMQWGSRASSRHGATRRGRIHDARIPIMKSQSFQGRTLEWRTASVLQNTRNWKRQKTNHESVAEIPQNAQYIPEEKAQKLRKLIQRNKRVNQKGNPVTQSKIEEASSKLHGKVLPKLKTAALRATLPKEKNSQKSPNGAAHVLTSDTLMTVIGSHETTVEFLHTDDQVNAELDQGDKNKEKVKLRVHIQPTRKHKNKHNQKTRADLQDASDLQLAIIRIPSISQKDSNAGCESVRPDSPLKHNPIQTHSGIAEGSLQTQMLTRPNLFGTGHCSAENSRRIAEDWSIQDPSLPLLSSMGERRNPPNYRNLETSSTQNNAPPRLTCNVLQSNKSGTVTCLRDINNIDVSLLPLAPQPKTMVSLRNNAAYAPEAWHSRQKEMEQIQVKDSQQAQVSHFLSTTLANHNSVSMQQFSRFPFSLSTTETPPWPGQLDRRNFLTAGSEGLNSSVRPPHFIQPMEVAKRISGACFTSQDFTAGQENLRHDTHMTDAGRNFSVLRENTEVHQYNPGSTQSLFCKDVCSAQSPSLPGDSRDNTWQAQNHSQRLPPWMQAAIQDQRSPAFSSMGLSLNSTSVLNATPNISPEMSRTLSMFEMIGNPVLRLMGKTMVLMPEAGGQGHVDLTTSHLSGQSTYINFFQSVEPQEANYESQRQLNGSQIQNFHMQPGIQQDYLSSDQFTCRNNEMGSSNSRSIPQLQDFFLRTPSSSQIPLADQSTNSQNNGVNIVEQNHPLLQGGSQLLSAMSHREHSNWQHQIGKSSQPFRPQSSLCCPRKQMRPNLAFSEGGGQYGSFRSNITLPQAPHNSMHNVHTNVTARNSSNFPSWLSGPARRTNTAHQPANIIILDDEGPLLSFDTSASGPLGRGVVPPSKPPAVAAAQQNSSSVECRGKIADSCRPAREKLNDRTYVPVIYTVGIESPGSVGPMVQMSATDHECRGVPNYATVMNSRKRTSCFGQPGESTKYLKSSERVLLTPNVSSTDLGKASALGRSKSGNYTVNHIPSMEALRAASERIQSMTRRGSISVSERLVGREPSEQDGVKRQPASNVSKESRLQAPMVGMCSINMNPAEVDCQDTAQFTSTPSLEIVSERIPVHNARAWMDTQGRSNVSMSPQPCVTAQDQGCSNWSLSSSNISTPSPALPHTTPMVNIQGFESSVGLPASSTSLTTNNQLLQALNKMTASKENSNLPIVYNASKKPSFCATLPKVPEASCRDFLSPPAIQSSLEALALSQGMQSLKPARKFVITNGRVSIMDVQGNKGSVHSNAMDGQKDKRFMHANMIDVQRDEESMHSNHTDKAVRNGNGQNQNVPDEMRQHESEGGAPAELTELMAAPGDTVCGSL